MKKLSFILLIIFIGCQKDNNNITVTRNDFIGNYCGEVTGSGSWNPFNTTISKSETDSNKIIIENLVSGDTVEAIVQGYNLNIPEQTYRKSESTSAGPWGEVIYYDLTVSGNGYFDPDKYSIQLNLTFEESYDDGDLKVLYSSIKMYKPYMYSYTGTFSGDSTTVAISPYNDSLMISVTFEGDKVPGGWSDLKASDDQCHLSFSVDSIEDIASGEMYEVRGGALKLGNSLKFSLFAYYHGISPLCIYDFTVTKQD